MLRPRTIFLATAFAFSLSAIGCGSASTEPNTQAGTGTSATDGTATKAAVAVNAHGMVKMVGSALADVPLRADQRTTIEKLASDAETRHQSTLTARSALANAVAAQVESGTIDQTALQPQIDALVASMEASRPADMAAFQQLHDTLDASQRQAFIDAFRAQMKAAHEAHEGHHGHGAKLEEWATALNLTDAQKDQIKTSMQNELAAHKQDFAGKMADMKAEHEKRKHALDNFAADDFKAADAMPAPSKEKAQEMSAHMIRIVQVVLPTLTPEQRKLAADKIRAKGSSQEEEGAPGPL